jgi:uncharacterized Zn finger protein
MPGWRDDWYPPPSVPRKAKGGIKARNKRGAFAATWWGERWIAVLESFNLGARLGRGRSYARKGQVVDLEIDAGKVTARVQGSRARPYSVSIAIKPIADAKWRKLAGSASENMAMSAKLLAGEMPPGIEEAFAAAGAPLFPAKVGDLKTDCSCPDWSNPCKHIAAVYYLLAEEFDRDPFLLFRLRGMERETFVAALGLGAGEGAAENEEETGAKAEPHEPLSADPETFWSGSGKAEDALSGVTIPPRSTPLVAGLGGFPFWRGEADFQTVVSKQCDAVAANGLRVFLGDPDVGAKTADTPLPPPATVLASRPRKRSKRSGRGSG